ncbi:MAG: helix-turn-helix domain-containing protein [Streptosporangiales bacterium]|nr:helix-turn-helix domain-containing protein [Streptosporangiales bacterium]
MRGQTREEASVGHYSAARPASGPTALRILLGSQLRRLREEKGIPREAAGDEIRASHTKISRMELGRVGFKERDVADLLTLYGVGDPYERQAFLSLARRANAPGWWHNYSDIVPRWFELYVGVEEAASVIRTYQVQFVPGLLQTEDYARAVTVLGYPHASAEEVARRVDLRMKRQELLTRHQPPMLWAVMDEAVVRRPLGGQRVMHAQLEHLLRISELPNVTLQIMPFRLGGHAAAGGPFTILRFPEPDLPDIVYLEQLNSALYLDKPEDADHYRMVMDQLCAQAAHRDDTTKLLGEAIDSSSWA